MLDRMEQLHLIQRVYDSKDRRKIQIVLTESSRKLSDVYTEVSREMNELFYQGFTLEEIQQFEQYLSRILSNLNEFEQSNK